MEIVDLNEDNKSVFSQLTGPDLLADLEREFYRGLGAVSDDGKPVGVLIYELKNCEEETDTKSEIMLLSSDSEEIREKLMETYRAAVSAEEVAESFYELPGQDYGDFFEKLGFENKNAESSVISITLEELLKLPIIKGKVPEHIGSIGDLALRQFRKGITRFLFMGKKGLLEDLAYLPMNWFETSVSAYSEQDGKINGFMLIRRTPSGTLDAKLLIAVGPDYVVNLVSMLRYSIQKASELYPPETINVIKRHNDQAKALAKKLFPAAKGVPAIRGERSEK